MDEIDQRAKALYDAAVPPELEEIGGPVPWEALVQDAVLEPYYAEQVEYWRELARLQIAETNPVKILRGEAAAQHGREMLMRITGTDNVEDAVRVALNQPVDKDPDTE